MFYVDALCPIQSTYGLVASFGEFSNDKKYIILIAWKH